MGGGGGGSRGGRSGGYCFESALIKHYPRPIRAASRCYNRQLMFDLITEQLSCYKYELLAY